MQIVLSFLNYSACSDGNCCVMAVFVPPELSGTPTNRIFSCDTNLNASPGFTNIAASCHWRYRQINGIVHRSKNKRAAEPTIRHQPTRVASDKESLVTLQLFLLFGSWVESKKNYRSVGNRYRSSSQNTEKNVKLAFRLIAVSL